MAEETAWSETVSANSRVTGKNTGNFSPKEGAGREPGRARSPALLHAPAQVQEKFMVNDRNDEVHESGYTLGHPTYFHPTLTNTTSQITIATRIRPSTNTTTGAGSASVT